MSLGEIANQNIVEIEWDKQNTWKKSFHCKKDDDLITLEVFRRDGDHLSKKDLVIYNYRMSESIREIENMKDVFYVDHGPICSEITDEIRLS